MRRTTRLRVLVTGSSGFLGRQVLARLQEDAEVYAIGRGDGASAGARVRWITQDLELPLDVRRLPRALDAVVHLAYVNGRRDPAGNPFAVNVAATAALMEYASAVGCRTFLYGSTGGVCGFRPRHTTERARTAPFDAHTLSKAQGEQVVRRDPRCAGVVIRYYFPYGPGQTNGLVPRLAASLAAGLPINLQTPRGHPRLNPVYVDDACELTVRALRLGNPLTLHCAGGETVSIESLARRVAMVLGTEVRFERGGKSSGDMLGATGLARRLLGWTPRVPLEDGLRRTFAAGEPT